MADVMNKEFNNNNRPFISITDIDCNFEENALKLEIKNYGKIPADVWLEKSEMIIDKTEYMIDEPDKSDHNYLYPGDDKFWIGVRGGKELIERLSESKTVDLHTILKYTSINSLNSSIVHTFESHHLIEIRNGSCNSPLVMDVYAD